MSENDAAPVTPAFGAQGPGKPQVNSRILAVIAAVVVVVGAVAFFSRGGSTTTTTVATSSLPKTLLDVALQFHNEGRLDDAVRAYKAVLATDPVNKFAFYNLGVIAQARKQLADAIDYYDKTLALDEEFNPARYNRGLAYKDNGQVNLAIEDLRAVVAKDAQNASAMYNLGQILIKQGNTEEGAKLVADAVAINPQLAAG